MTESQLFDWLRLQQPKLDAIIAKSAREFETDQLKVRPQEQFGFDLAECQTESWHLFEGKDLCYDRPNTPFVYSLWYHARRVNTFLSHFANTLINTQDKSIQLFDLGAGTGAVQWAVGLIYCRMKELGKEVPKIKIINVDTSPFMLYYGRDYLWKNFKVEYPNCIDFDNIANPIEYEINSWSNKQSLKITNCWISASYLFDSSDADEKGDEYKQAVLKAFHEIFEKYKPATLLLLSSKAKESLVEEVAKEFSSSQFLIQKLRYQKLILTGKLDLVSNLRSELFQRYKPYLSSSREQSINRAASWDDGSFVGTLLTKKQTEIFTSSDAGLSLYNPAIKVRRDVQLNDEQKKAARNIDQPTVIIGPAGCGKSIVITERIKNIVEGTSYAPNLSILLTTFNIKLLAQLTAWLLDILDSNNIDRVEGTAPCKIFFKGNRTLKENIYILHFDMLPKFLGGIPGWRLVDESEHVGILHKIILEVKVNNQITDSRHDDILNPTFLLEEYQRVIYGLQVGIRNSKVNYLNVSRKGRGVSPKLDRNSERRELVWSCLENYGRHIFGNHVPSFVLRRQLFLNALKQNLVNPSFDYVVVDEFQDCTKADFEIFFHLITDPNHLVISGDLAQAVHLGRSANIDVLREAIRTGRSIKDISWNYLEGSYRLPFRICEAIRRISEHINSSFRGNRAASIITPYKGAPPGARPIIVVGKNEVDISTKISTIVSLYQKFDLKDNCILERDDSLSRLVRIESDTILRLKGLEKHCVIWSTRAALEFKKEKFEFAYTIVSRTACILIIALLENQTQNIFKEVIELLKDKNPSKKYDKLIFWDRDTKVNFESYCQPLQLSTLEEED